MGPSDILVNIMERKIFENVVVSVTEIRQRARYIGAELVGRLPYHLLSLFASCIHDSFMARAIVNTYC